MHPDTLSLLEHQPLSSFELAHRRQQHLELASRTHSRAILASKVLMGAGAAAFGYYLLATLEGHDSIAVLWLPVLAGGLALAGYGRAARAQAPQAALARWQIDAGLTELSSAEIEQLRGLCLACPVATRQLASWDALGLVLRRRDRAALELHLKTKGITVPSREDDDFDLFQEAISNASV